MKKILRTLFAAMLLSLVVMESQAQQLVVKNPPENKKTTPARPPRPSPEHIWIEEEWVLNDGGTTYVAKEAAWVKPPTPNSVWVHGYWKKEKDGWAWIPGHWTIL